MVRKPTEKDLLCGLEICELCRGFKGTVLFGQRGKTVAAKPDSILLQKPDDIVLLNRCVRQLLEATGIVECRVRRSWYKSVTYVSEFDIRHIVGLIFQGAPSRQPSRPPTIPIPQLGPLDRQRTGLTLKLEFRRLKDLKMNGPLFEQNST